MSFGTRIPKGLKLDIQIGKGHLGLREENFKTKVLLPEA